MTQEHWSSEALKKERIYEQEWIQENMYLFDPLARDGYSMRGRGAIVVNVAEFIQRNYADEGHPFNYLRVEDMNWIGDDEFWVTEGSQPREVWRLIDTYNPASQLVVVLEKFVAQAAYQRPLLLADEIDLEIRGAYVNAEAEERKNRLVAPDLWGRGFRLASPYALLWSANER